MRDTLCFLFVVLAAHGLMIVDVFGEERAEANQGPYLFAVRILPLLEAKCFPCHGGDNEDIRGGLDLTSRASMIRGGDTSDEVLMPGAAGKILLYAAVTWLVSAWESYPQSGELASELAERAMELGKYDVALKVLRALAAMRTPAPISRPMALLKQAEIAKLQGDGRKAGFLAKKALAEDPEFADAQVFIDALGQNA